MSEIKVLSDTGIPKGMENSRTVDLLPSTVSIIEEMRTIRARVA